MQRIRVVALLTLLITALVVLAACGDTGAPATPTTVATAIAVATATSAATATLAATETAVATATGASVATISDQPNDDTQARLRVSQCVFGAPDVDVYLNGVIPAGSGVPMPKLRPVSVSRYEYLAPATYSLAVVPGGQDLSAALLGPLDVTVAAGHRYTVVVLGQQDEPTHKALVIDETAAYQAIGVTPADTAHITVNNIRGVPGIDFTLGGVVRDKNAPYGGFVAAVWPTGKFKGLAVTVSGSPNQILDSTDEELDNGAPGFDFLDCFGGTYPGKVGQDFDTRSSSSTRTLAAVQQDPSIPTVASVLQFTGHTDAVTQAAFSPDGKKVVTTSWDLTARIWDAASGKELLRLSGHSADLVGVVFSPDGKTVLTTSDDQTGRLWDTTSGKELRTFVGTSPARRAAFSPDGKYVVIGGTTDATVWDVASGQRIFSFTDQARPSRVAFAPDGNAVVTAGNDGSVLMWNPLSGKVLMSFKGHTDFVNSPAFSSDGKYLVTPSNDFTARVWDVASGAELLRLETPGIQVQAVAFSPDGTLIATAGNDGLARLWDAQSGKELRHFTGHTEELRSVVFSPDGKYILTASLDHTARIWPIN